MKLILTILLIFGNTVFLLGQNKPLTYTKEIGGVSLSKDEIFDRVTKWFDRSFFNTHDKIKVSNRQSGVISANAIFYSAYKVPNGADSTLGEHFVNYNFEWQVKINGNRVSFTINKIFINSPSNSIPVTSSKQIPFVIIMQTEEKSERDWALAKNYLMKNLDGLTTSLYAELSGDNNSSLAGAK